MTAAQQQSVSGCQYCPAAVQWDMMAQVQLTGDPYTTQYALPIKRDQSNAELSNCNVRSSTAADAAAGHGHHSP